MKYYELTYLITPDLPEEEARAFQAKVNSFIADEGMLEEGNVILKKKLAYAIEKKDDAYMAVATFNALPEKIAPLEKKLKAEKNILRYLLIIKEKRQTLRIRPHMARAKAELKETAEKKVELKEIDKKLDEILDEPQ
ncbi:MAG: 30S ribosomal protein S6 [Candidatus Paceibacterota bacterium]|jgi:small subunit ribosomal protein S6